MGIHKGFTDHEFEVIMETPEGEIFLFKYLLHLS